MFLEALQDTTICSRHRTAKPPYIGDTGHSISIGFFPPHQPLLHDLLTRGVESFEALDHASATVFSG